MNSHKVSLGTALGSKASRLLCVATALLSGCAGTFKSTVNFNTAQPIRIAVLPFAQVNSRGELSQVDENYLIDNVVLVSSKLKDTPAEFVQGLVQAELGKASLDVLAPGVVQAELLHNGYDKDGSNPVHVDLDKIFATPASTICGKVLSCDAVLYGKVKKWDRSYYGIQATATVAIELKLVSAKDGRVLFESYGEDDDSRGLTKGPTGFSDLVIEPLKGLDNQIVTDLARSVVQGLVKPLYAKNRPEFLKTAPPAIFAAAHDAPSGTLSKQGKLTVIALGSANQDASFAIGNIVQGIPMVERSPGHYIGEYEPLPSDSFTKQKVVVSLQDQYGRAITQTLGHAAVSLQ